VSPAPRFARALKQRLIAWSDERRARQLVAAASTLAGRPRGEPRLLTFTAAGPGSLGDEAMLVAAGAQMRARGVARQTVVSYGPGDDWQPLGTYDTVLAFGDRYRTAFWDTCRELMDAFADATHFLALGADVMDGYYSPYEAIRRAIYVRLAHAAGLQAAIGGFSFNATPHPRSVAALAAVPAPVALIARDPVSYRRLGARLARPVRLGADLAFLLEPTPDTPVVRGLTPWLQEQRDRGRLLVGVNANYLVDPRHRQADNGDALSTAYAEGLAAFCREHGHVSLVFLPHDYRRMAGRYDDLQLLQVIAARLPQDVAANLRVVADPLRAAEAKAIAGELDLVVSGRMHLAIAALGAGVPAAGITYQGKFEGLYEHLDLTDVSLGPDALFTPGALGRFLGSVAARRDDLAARIGARLPAIRALAGVNLEALCGERGGGD
jgi:polysaccharide pyruvyl transferase WcaK-like protein